MNFSERVRDMSFTVTKNHRYTEYSCEAMEEDLVSERSDPVQINPLCKITFIYTIVKLSSRSGVAVRYSIRPASGWLSVRIPTATHLSL